jgi:arginine decarboxylase
VLVKIAQELDSHTDDMSVAEAKLHQIKVESLTKRLPALPDFSRFHRHFRSADDGDTPEGDMRKAYFMAYNDELTRYVTMDELKKRVTAGAEVVSTTFVIPYPPGFPLLVPGQVISGETLAFIEARDVKEIHGYRPELGFRVFSDEALDAAGATAKSRPPAAEVTNIRAA